MVDQPATPGSLSQAGGLSLCGAIVTADLLHRLAKTSTAGPTRGSDVSGDVEALYPWLADPLHPR